MNTQISEPQKNALEALIALALDGYLTYKMRGGDRYDFIFLLKTIKAVATGESTPAECLDILSRELSDSGITFTDSPTPYALLCQHIRNLLAAIFTS